MGNSAIGRTHTTLASELTNFGKTVAKGLKRIGGRIATFHPSTVAHGLKSAIKTLRNPVQPEHKQIKKLFDQGAVDNELDTRSTPFNESPLYVAAKIDQSGFLPSPDELDRIASQLLGQPEVVKELNERGLTLTDLVTLHAYTSVRHDQIAEGARTPGSNTLDESFEAIVKKAAPFHLINHAGETVKALGPGKSMSLGFSTDPMTFPNGIKITVGETGGVAVDH